MNLPSGMALVQFIAHSQTFDSEVPLIQLHLLPEMVGTKQELL